MLLPRAMGALTLLYGVSAVARPDVIERHGELLPSEATRLLSTLVGIRDIVSGTLMLTAPRGRPLQSAVALRVAFDLGDAAAFGTLLPTPGARRKIAAVALAWGGLCAATLPHARA
jgi:hypothetical protein